MSTPGSLLDKGGHVAAWAQPAQSSTEMRTPFGNMHHST